MKNKKLLSLVLIPLLLAGCGGSKKPDAGQRGENVLNDEARAAIAQQLNEPVKRSSKTEGKALSLSIDSSKEDEVAGTSVTHSGVPLMMVTRNNGEQPEKAYHLYSVILAKEVLKLVEEEGATYTVTGGYFDTSIVGVNLRIAYEKIIVDKVDAESKHHYQTLIIDHFGNELFNVAHDETAINPAIASSTRPVHGELDSITKYELFVTFSYFDKEEGKQKFVFNKYDDAMATSKVEVIDKDAKGITSIATTLFEGMDVSFKKDDVDYKVHIGYELADAPKMTFDVTHEGKKGEETLHLAIDATVANNGQLILGSSVIYQEKFQVVQTDPDYTYTDGTGTANVFALRTRKLDLVSGEESVVEFPYLLGAHEFSLDGELNVMEQQTNVPTYTAVRAYEIKDKSVNTQQSKVYLLDENLVLHDDVTNLINTLSGLEKFGNNYLDEAEKKLFDANLNLIGTIQGNIIERFDDMLIIENTVSGKYGVLGSDGKYIVTPSYDTYHAIGSKELIFVIDPWGTPEYARFDFATKTVTSLNFDPEVTYQYTDMDADFYIAKGGEEEGAKDKVFLLGAEVASYDKGSTYDGVLNYSYRLNDGDALRGVDHVVNNIMVQRSSGSVTTIDVYQTIIHSELAK